MAGNTVVPLTNLSRRPPEAGRIRLGVKTAKGMKSIDTFRFTSARYGLIEQIAAIYGGTPKPWSDPKARIRDQWEVITSSNEIAVYLVPDGLSIWYEQWSGGGCVRRCDGVECETPQQVGSGYELMTVPCMCRAQGVRQCSPYTRLTVVLPNIAFAGVWRLDTKGWNAAAELPGMYDMIVTLGQQGTMVRAVLGVDRREQQTHNGKRNYVVPRLGIEESVLQLQQGMANADRILAAGDAIATPALPAPAPAPDPQDDDITDAVLVDDELHEIEDALRADARNFGLDPDRYVSLLHHSTNSDRTKMRNASVRVRAGEFEPIGFTATGIQWKNNRS